LAKGCSIYWSSSVLITLNFKFSLGIKKFKSSTYLKDLKPIINWKEKKTHANIFILINGYQIRKGKN